MKKGKIFVLKTHNKRLVGQLNAIGVSPTKPGVNGKYLKPESEPIIIFFSEPIEISFFLALVELWTKQPLSIFSSGPAGSP